MTSLGWTAEVGQAFLNQQEQVMESIQRLRQSAMNYGNLQSTPQAQVDYDNGDIEIEPTDPNVLYLPVYQPDYVYGQSGYGVGFGVGCGIGPWLNCDFDWPGHHLYFWDRNHARPSDWWHERGDQRLNWLARQGTVWRPGDHRGLVAVRSGDRGWGTPAPRRTEPNNMIVNMSRPGASPRPVAAPRPVATPRPATVGKAGAFHLQSTPAPVKRSAASAFIGGGSAREARTISNRGRESMRAVTQPAPVHSQPARSAAPASRPAPASGGGSHPRR